MEYCIVTYYHFNEPVTVAIPKGLITPDVEKAFTRGQCHAFSLALHEKTKWPIYGLFTEDELDAQETPGHVIVKSPWGFVDIQGLGAECRWPERKPVRVTKKAVLTYNDSETYRDTYLDPQVDVARDYVEPVLKLVEKQNKKQRAIPCSY